MHTEQTQIDIIDLNELLQILKVRKKLIFFIILLSILLSVVYVTLAKPVYEVRAMIEVGKIGDKPLDDIQNIKQKLEYIYAVYSKNKREFPRVKSIHVSKKSKSIFNVVVEGYQNKEATEYIQHVASKVEEEYSSQVNAYIQTQNELIHLTKEDIIVAKENFQKVEKTLKNYNQKIMNITAKDAALAGIYTIQISQNQIRSQDLQARISELKAKIYNLELTITPLKIKQTHIVGKIEVLDKPVKPKKLLIIVITFMTGLMFSIFLVFFLSFLQKNYLNKEYKNL